MLCKLAGGDHAGHTATRSSPPNSGRSERCPPRILSHHRRLGRERRRRTGSPRVSGGTDLLCLAWRERRRVPMDTLRRIGYIAGIYQALQIVYSDAHLADGWIKRPNGAFGGRSPLDRMKGGDVVDLAAVRAYLDAARAPWS